MILVTGGCGFIGAALVKRLLDEGHEVRVLDNASRGTRQVNGADYFHGDVRVYHNVKTALKGCSEVIHLAYINGTKNFYERPGEVLNVAVKGMDNLLDACGENGVKRFLLVSSSEVCRAKLVGVDEAIPLVIPDPFNPRYSYSAGKIISEMLAIHCGLFDRLIIVRPFNIYGPGMEQGHVIPDFIAQLGNEKFEVLGDGNETRSFCYIDDFIDGLMIARGKGQHNDVFNIGVEKETSISDLAMQVWAAGRKTSSKIVYLGKLREGDAQRRRPDISKLRALGYEPKIDLEEGLRRTIDAMSKLRTHAA